MLYPELDQDQILYEELRRKYFDEWDEQPFGMLFWGGDHGEEDTSLYLAVVEPPQFGHYLDEDLLKRILDYFGGPDRSPKDQRLAVEKYYPDFAKRYYGQGSTA
ncbi:hypothetical protein LA343_01540 [Corynebacterium falsenii]|uniref:hypothetical protein n=1 Tax=Corynebacterium falsenii TaxID=108486 RepID=UPI001CCD6461|nr:hypothetical protein [Corynebacterium falsenii]UBI04887.1 hypothetical protein LA343_01540 [Corynebacterium falsenii]